MDPETVVSTALRTAYLRLPHATVLLDEAGRCVEANPAAHRLFGHDVAAAHEHLEAYVAGGRSPFARDGAGLPDAVLTEARIRRRDGILVDVECTAVPD